MNSSSLFLVGSLLTASAPFVTKSTNADRSMLDIAVTPKGIEKLLSNLKPHKAAGPDQIKDIILK